MTTLEPGRELDALVASKVMEVRVDPVGCGCNDCATGESIWPPEVPPYSTDISAAWAVVEKLNEAHWCHVAVYPDEYTDPNTGFERQKGFVCHIELDDGTARVAHADTAPHAICLAALRVVTTDSADAHRIRVALEEEGI